MGSRNLRFFMNFCLRGTKTRRGYARWLWASERHGKLRLSPAGQPMCVYGDPAYPLRIHLQAPYRQGRLTQQMEDYNKAMSEVRVSVEWLFGDIINSFKFLDNKKNLKIGLSSVGKMYIVCALLRNAITCLYGNQTSEFFDLEPPTLEEYFQ